MWQWTQRVSTAVWAVRRDEISSIGLAPRCVVAMRSTRARSSIRVVGSTRIETSIDFHDALTVTELLSLPPKKYQYKSRESIKASL